MFITLYFHSNSYLLLSSLMTTIIWLIIQHIFIRKSEESTNEPWHKTLWDTHALILQKFGFVPAQYCWYNKDFITSDCSWRAETLRAKCTSTGQSFSVDLQYLYVQIHISYFALNTQEKLGACRCSNRLTDAILFCSKNTCSNFFTERPKAQRYLKSSTPLIDTHDAFSHPL